MNRKRGMIVLVGIICFFAIFIGRLIEIQLVKTERFSKREINLLEASVNQRTQQLEIDNGRGSFLDRNGELLQDEKRRVLVLFPFLQKIDWDVEKVAQITGTTKEQLINAVNQHEEPFVFQNGNFNQLTEEQMEKINELKIPGVFAIEKKFRLENEIANQFIGITGQNEELLKTRYPKRNLPKDTIIGLTGLEKSFDEFLLSDGNSRLIYHVDGLGDPLFGINVKYVEPANSFYPVNIKTTVDKTLQQLGEKLVEKHNIEKGGLLLLDIETNSVLSIVSRPKINAENPFDSMGIHNMMVQAHIPGSVFKTVVAAAAIEKQLDDPSRTFDCNRTIMGKKDPYYHYGLLNFSDSFAKSCNNTFGTLAKELMEIDKNILEDYGNKLGLLGPVIWTGPVFHDKQFRQLDDEQPGRIFLHQEAKKDKNFVAMTGIGQHEVRLSPLGIGNMMATIARGGEAKMVRVVSEIEYKNGTSLFHFDDQPLDIKKQITPYTAMKLQKLLRSVVTNEDGTGNGLADLPYGVAGKSGTAETGIEKDGKELVNRWFAGYFPFDDPRYVLVTVHLETGEGGSVIPLFRDMVNEIYKLEKGEE